MINLFENIRSCSGDSVRRRDYSRASRVATRCRPRPLHHSHSAPATPVYGDAYLYLRGTAARTCYGERGFCRARGRHERRLILLGASRARVNKPRPSIRGVPTMPILTSDRVPRLPWPGRFPVPRNFNVSAESRIERGKTWPAASGATRRRKFAVYRYDPDPGGIRVSTPSKSISTIAVRWFSMRSSGSRTRSTRR